MKKMLLLILFLTAGCLVAFADNVSEIIIDGKNYETDFEGSFWRNGSLVDVESMRVDGNGSSDII